MGFLDQHNPRATRKTVICAAIVGAGGFFLFALFMLLLTDFPVWGWVFMLIFMTVSGAVSGAAMEWQLPEGLISDGSESIDPSRENDTQP